MVITCRICLEEGSRPLDFLFAPCNCKGSRLYVHASCLRTWQIKRQEALDPIQAYTCGVCLATYSYPPDNCWTIYYFCKKTLIELYNVIYAYSGLSLYLYGKIMIGLTFAVGLIIGPSFQVIVGAMSLMLNLLMRQAFVFKPYFAPRLKRKLEINMRLHDNLKTDVSFSASPIPPPSFSSSF